MKNKVIKISLGVVILFVIVFGAISFAGEESRESAFSAFPTKDIFGEKIVYDSKYYLVDAWATWCPPCVYSIPELSLFAEEYGERGLMVLGLSVDRGVKEVVSFVESNDVPYAVAMMSSAANRALPSFRSIPTMFLLDNKGVVLWRHTGAMTKVVLEKELKEYIKELSVSKNKR